MNIVYDKKYLEEVTENMRKGEEFVRRYVERTGFPGVKKTLDEYALDVTRSRDARECLTAVLCCSALLRGGRDHVRRELGPEV